MQIDNCVLMPNKIHLIAVWSLCSKCKNAEKIVGKAIVNTFNRLLQYPACHFLVWHASPVLFCLSAENLMIPELILHFRT